MEPLLKDAIICLTISIIISNIVFYKGISYLKEDADASDSESVKKEKNYSVWSIITGWIMLVFFLFFSLFFPSRRFI